MSAHAGLNPLCKTPAKTALVAMSGIVRVVNGVIRDTL